MEWKTIIPMLIGATLAMISPLASVLINSKKDRKIALIKSASEAAVKDFEISTKIAIENKLKIYPLSSYMFYHIKFLELAEKGKLDLNEINKTLKTRRHLLELYKTVSLDGHPFLMHQLEEINEKDEQEKDN